jgi:hypothetical protein
MTLLHHHILILLSLLTLSLAQQPCGTETGRCPTGQACLPFEPFCPSGENCAGTCEHKYPACGGRFDPIKLCPLGHMCLDDTRREWCGMACDEPGICVRPVLCGGFTGAECKDGKKCYDDPRDECNPKMGGKDCVGICL